MPIDWEYIRTLPERERLALELYMEGRVFIGGAADIAGLPFRKFDEIRIKARVQIRGSE